MADQDTNTPPLAAPGEATTAENPPADPHAGVHNPSTLGAFGATQDPTDPIHTAWTQVLEGWDDDQTHSRFLALCVQLDRMPDAGRRYREVREQCTGGTPEDEARAAEAQRRIDKLVGFAMATMLEQRTVPSKAPRRAITVIAAVLMFASIIAATWTLLRFTG